MRIVRERNERKLRKMREGKFGEGYLCDKEQTRRALSQKRPSTSEGKHDTKIQGRQEQDTSEGCKGLESQRERDESGGADQERKRGWRSAYCKALVPMVFWKAGRDAHRFMYCTEKFISCDATRKNKKEDKTRRGKEERRRGKEERRRGKKEEREGGGEEERGEGRRGGEEERRRGKEEERRGR
eukprot:747973-Hanusia_phi.AAC.3